MPPTVITLVMDAVGLTTLDYLLDKFPGEVHLPHFQRMGLGNILAARHHSRIRPEDNPLFSYALHQVSAEADSVIGHREMVGVTDPRQYELFFSGFSVEYIRALEQQIGRRTLYNEMAGGMEAIEKNSEEHTRTGWPIVYSSVCDPLIQIATDEAVIPVEEAHRITDAAFDLAIEMGIPITRAISRTYVLRDGEVVRTPNRYDRVLDLDKPTLLDALKEAGIFLVSVGKPAELVPSSLWDRKIKLSNPNDLESGLRFVHPKQKDTNPYSIQGTLQALREAENNGTFIFVNCVDTDSLYGHTQQVEGSLRSIEEIDRCVPRIVQEMREGDVLLVTADHGMLHAGDRAYHAGLPPQFSDYGYHNREPVPLLGLRKGGDLNDIRVPTTKTFAAVGHITAQVLGVKERYVSLTSFSER